MQGLCSCCSVNPDQLFMVVSLSSLSIGPQHFKAPLREPGLSCSQGWCFCTVHKTKCSWVLGWVGVNHCPSAGAFLKWQPPRSQKWNRSDAAGLCLPCLEENPGVGSGQWPVSRGAFSCGHTVGAAGNSVCWVVFPLLEWTFLSLHCMWASSELSDGFCLWARTCP